MIIRIFDKDCEKYYEIHPGHEAAKTWVRNEDGEGGDFKSSDIHECLFQALDKFFKENH